MTPENASPEVFAPASLPDAFDWERLVISTGTRSGATIIIAVHSTLLGPALGGCRVRSYPTFGHGVADAMNLSKAMSYKCAIGNVASGGGKTVVLPPSKYDRRDLLLDIGDAVESLDGIYATGGDYGTTSEDMVIVRERTRHVLGLPVAHGGIGTPAEPTSRGVLAAMRSVAEHLWGNSSLEGRHVVISGLGSVGGRLAIALAGQGAQLTVTDIDSAKRVLAERLGATWVEPTHEFTVDADIACPSSVGGVIDYEMVGRLHCKAVVGPANNQLAESGVADALLAQGVLWAPDFLVNAGGVIYGAGIEVERLSRSEVDAKVEAIGSTLTEVLQTSESRRVSPYAVAMELAEARLKLGSGTS